MSTVSVSSSCLLFLPLSAVCFPCVCVCVCTYACEGVCPCLAIEPRQTDTRKGGEMGKVCQWKDMGIRGKRDACTAVMGPIRLRNRAQTVAENHVKKTPNWLLQQAKFRSILKPMTDSQ